MAAERRNDQGKAKPVSENGSRKALTMTAVGSVLATIVSLTTIHTTFILPATVAKARAEAEGVILRAIQEHARHPHKDAITRGEFDLIRDQLKSLQADVKQLLQR